MKRIELLTGKSITTKSNRVAGASCRPLAGVLGWTALLAIGFAAPGRADVTKPDPEVSTAITTTLPAASDGAQSSPAPNLRVEDTVLPSGIVRRTLRPAHSNRSARDAEMQPEAFALPNNLLTMPLHPDILSMRRQGAAARSGAPVNLRLGVSVSPRIKFVGGVDVTLPHVSIGPGFSTRVDFDAVVSANFGGVTTLFPLTFDEIYHLGLPAGSGVYGGIGIGPMLGEDTRFGGKIILGGHLTSRLTLEGNVIFAGYGDALFNVQLRLPIL
jgi:hypothetical protein